MRPVSLASRSTPSSRAPARSARWPTTGAAEIAEGAATTPGYARHVDTSIPAVLDAQVAMRYIGAAASGRAELLGALAGAPLLAVDIGDDDVMTSPLPPWLPCVVVGIARRSVSGPAPIGVDVALTVENTTAAPPGWIVVANVDEELQRLSQRVVGSAGVAVVFVQTLRVSETLGPFEGLVLESITYSALQGGPSFQAWLADRRFQPRKERFEQAETVISERVGDSLVITLNRPHVRNAVSARLRDELCRALELAASDESVLAIELRGAGASFCSGGDLDEFGTLPDTTVAHLVRTTRSPARLMAIQGDRMTARIHGACVGAGIELSAFARRVVAATDTVVRLPEVELGLVPGAGGTVSIPRRIGRQRTAWLGLSGATIDVETAARWRLVDEISLERPGPGAEVSNYYHEFPLQRAVGGHPGGHGISADRG